MPQPTHTRNWRLAGSSFIAAIKGVSVLVSRSVARFSKLLPQPTCQYTQIAPGGASSGDRHRGLSESRHSVIFVSFLSRYNQHICTRHSKKHRCVCALKKWHISMLTTVTVCPVLPDMRRQR